MKARTCSICDAATREVFCSSSEVSITSLAAFVDGRTTVFICDRCSHAETASLFDLRHYYDTEYKIGALGADDDDLYSVDNGRSLLRSEHTANVFLEKTAGFDIHKVLDYGCGKSLALKRAMASNPMLDVHLFDVSRDYAEFWADFLPAEKCAVFEPPAEWNGQFDCVTSFFSLEHVQSPRDVVRKMWTLLKQGGLLYAIVPNVYSINRADLLVVDHLHHYSLPSMSQCLTACGFELLECDDRSHQQASIYIARAVKLPQKIALPDGGKVATALAQMSEIASYWLKVEERLYAFEKHLANAETTRVFIYGAGIVGMYLYSRLRNKSVIAGFIDSNVYKQKKLYNGLTVMAPSAVTIERTDGLLVGLNPGVGKSVICSMPQFDRIQNNVFYC